MATRTQQEHHHISYQGNYLRRGSENDLADVFFGGVTSLAEHLDRNIMLVLRDGRVLIGTLSSYDQYGSIVLSNSKERLVAKNKFADVDMGLYMIRGENIMLLGEVDAELDANNPLLTRADQDVVEALLAETKEEKSGGVVGGAKALT